VLYARNKRREPYSFFNLILTLSKIPISWHSYLFNLLIDKFIYLLFNTLLFLMVVVL
jgi:hypothetical protein